MAEARAAASLSGRFEELREGDAFATATRTVTAEDIAAFAARTGDTHPQHTDAEWSASSAFGERIAPGALTLAYSLGLMSFDCPQIIALRRIADVVFTRPVKAGDTLSVSGRVAALTPIDAGAGMVTVVLLTKNQQGQTACRARIQLTWRREPHNPNPTTEEPTR